ncbi:MAG: flagellar biosynthetic protein FliO [Candidatus Hydrogenedentes bacterium]|nr:flagellar biosynthetic protein FliO [Candidatus Hydrogenedentota bacterium]
MKNSLLILISFSITGFCLSLCSYCEEKQKLSNVEDSLQSLIKTNEATGSEGNSNGKSLSDSPKGNQDWFIQHQKAWDSEGSKEVGEGESNNRGGTTEGTVGERYSEVSRGGSYSWGYYFVRAGVAFLLVLGLLLAVLGGMKLLIQRSPSKYGKVLGKVIGVVYLSPRARVYYLQTGGKVVALGVSGDRINLLFSMNEDEFFSNVPDVEESDTGKDKSFRKVLEDVEQRIKEKSDTEKESGVGSDFDNEIASLKANIQKLQEVLREDSEGEERK